MGIGRPVGRTQAQLERAAATKRRAREFERATSSPAGLLGWTAPDRAASVEYSSERGAESPRSGTSTQERSGAQAKEESK